MNRQFKQNDLVKFRRLAHEARAAHEQGKSVRAERLARESDPIAQALGELWRESPDLVVDQCLDSLDRSARMMKEVVEETQRDLVEFERLRKEIDEKQAETRAMLAEVLFGRSQ